jgi:hypothetical protein
MSGKVSHTEGDGTVLEFMPRRRSNLRVVPSTCFSFVRRRGVLIRDAYWALIIAIIVVGGAKLFGVL